MKIESKTVSVQKSANDLCHFLGDVKNYEQLMPDTINKFEIIRENAFVFGLKGMPEIALAVKEVNAPNEVILGALSDKLDFNLTAHISEVSKNTSEAAFLFEGNFNTMMKMMIKGPITKFLETLATNLETV